MDPTIIIGIIQAAAAVAGPALKAVITEFEVIGADVSAHKSALQTFEDALAALGAVFTTPPVRPTA